MNTVSEIATWGPIVDAKMTGLSPNQGKICPLCGEDSGQSPVRLDFFNSMKSNYFHRDCAMKLENADGSFFGSMKKCLRSAGDTTFIS